MIQLAHMISIPIGRTRVIQTCPKRRASPVVRLVVNMDIVTVKITILPEKVVRCIVEI